MSLELFKEAIEKKTDHLDFMLTRFKIDKDFSIQAKEAYHNDWSNPEDMKITQFDLAATFYGAHFKFVLLSKRIDSDEPIFSMIEALEQNKLMESFEASIEEDYWEHIKVFCKRYEELEKIDCTS